MHQFDSGDGEEHLISPLIIQFLVIIIIGLVLMTVIGLISKHRYEENLSAAVKAYKGVQTGETTLPPNA